MDIEQRRVQNGDRLYLGALRIDGSYEDGPVSGYGFCDLVGPIGPDR
ncbi:hypothetical protein [Nocardia carnea]|nr:hypothetical protein [Nocardia carnea]